MDDERIVVLEISTIEAAHLAGLVEQFQDLLAVRDTDADDPALNRLTPDAYPDDLAASREFNRLTHAELLRRREDDAGVLLRTLFPSGDVPDPVLLERLDAVEPLVIALAEEEARAWLRTLAAIRLVLASRLGITDESDHADDPRFAVYEWLAMRVDGLVQALEGPDSP